MKKWTVAIAVAISVILGSCGGSQGTVFISESESTMQSEASEISERECPARRGLG